MRPAPLSLIDPWYVPSAVTAPPEARLGVALAELERFGVERAGLSLDDDPALAELAFTRAPERFFARTEADPRRGMDELRRIERLVRTHDLRAVTVSPARLLVAIDHAFYFPLFAKCCELDVAICPSLGVPVERVPFGPQKVERIDAVACFFPELRIVMRGDCAPWQALAVLLMRRHPNLHFTTGTPGPNALDPELAEFANEDGAHQLLFASSGRGLETATKELGGLPLARRVWPRFLRENAVRVFRL